MTKGWSLPLESPTPCECVRRSHGGTLVYKINELVRRCEQKTESERSHTFSAHHSVGNICMSCALVLSTPQGSTAVTGRNVRGFLADGPAGATGLAASERQGVSIPLASGTDGAADGSTGERQALSGSSSVFQVRHGVSVPDLAA